MVRTYVPETERRPPPVGVLDRTREIVRSGVSIRKAADEYGIPFIPCGSTVELMERTDTLLSVPRNPGKS